MSHILTFDIEVYDEWGDDHWAQEKYLVHGYDVFWTSSAEDAAAFLKQTLDRVKPCN